VSLHGRISTSVGFSLTRGVLDEAIVAFRKGIEIHPRYGLKPDVHVWAHIGLGDALKRQGKLDLAIAAYRKSIEVDPKFVRGHHALIVTLQQQGKWQEALIWLGKATALDPAHPYDRNELAWYFVAQTPEELRQPALWRQACRGAVELEPEAGIYWNTLGVAHYRAGDLESRYRGAPEKHGASQGGKQLGLVLPGHGPRKARRQGAGSEMARPGHPMDGEKQRPGHPMDGEKRRRGSGVVRLSSRISPVAGCGRKKEVTLSQDFLAGFAGNGH